MGACTRCKMVTETKVVGLLELCGGCQVSPPCPEYQHAYQAAPGEQGGLWVCLQCGAVLRSTPIEVQTVEAVSHQLDAYC